jgi:ribosomal protein S18 acetylase RimI-like enzyme
MVSDLRLKPSTADCTYLRAMSQETQMSITIRRCTVADAPALTALARRTFYDTFTGTCTEADMQQFLDTFYYEAQIVRELGNPADYTFFAETDGRPVGFLRFLESVVPFPCDARLKPLELNRLYVDEAYKGTGVAQQLTGCYLQFAADNNCDFLWLGVWEHNYRAQAFYRRYGFSFTGYRHPFPIGDTPQTDEWWSMVR